MLFCLMLAVLSPIEIVPSLCLLEYCLLSFSLPATGCLIFLEVVAFTPMAIELVDRAPAL